MTSGRKSAIARLSNPLPSPFDVSTTRPDRNIYEEMNSKLKKAVKKIADIIGSTASSSIVAVWSVGEIVNEIYNNIEEYGENALQQVASYFGVTIDTLDNYRSIYNSFSKEKIIEVSKSTQKMIQNFGRSLTMSHLIFLSWVKDQETRYQLVDQTIENGWTADELRERIKVDSLAPFKRTNKGGRPYKKFSTLLQCLQNVIKHTQSFTKRFNEMWLDNEYLGSESPLWNDLHEGNLSKNELSKHIDIMEQLKDILTECKEYIVSLVDILDDHISDAKEYVETVTDHPTRSVLLPKSINKLSSAKSQTATEPATTQ